MSDPTPGTRTAVPNEAAVLNEPVSASDRVGELERRLASLEAKNERLTHALSDAREALIRAKEKLRGVGRAPSTIAVVLATDDERREVEVMLSGRVMRLSVAVNVDMASLVVGQRVRVDEDMTVSEALPPGRNGQVMTVIETVGVDRVLVGADTTNQRVVTLASALRHGNLKTGDSLVVDPVAGIATEKLIRRDVEQLLAPEVPDVTYADIGGLDEQIRKVRDAVEMPFQHPDLYRRYRLRPPQGILLYGPPGCGKTLIAKAVARSLADARGRRTPYFLSIKGPELLNKYVGETERHIRAIFARARALASTDVPVVIFFDEMEALLRTRGSGISSDVETMIVPQMLAEIDGVERLDNVIVIGASNREDMIDPAVLRPGRLDIRIRVDRPTMDGARDIFGKYLTDDLPLASENNGDNNGDSLSTKPSRATLLIDHIVASLFTRSDRTVLFDLNLRDGTKRSIHVCDLVSGAMIAAIVERAKKFAIHDTICGRPGLTVEHLERALDEEIRETADLSATSTPQEWARVTGLRADGIAAIHQRHIERATPGGQRK